MNQHPTREQLDSIAWGVIKTADVEKGTPMPYAHTECPTSFTDFGQMVTERGFEMAWSEFLHTIYRYRTAQFFAEPPPRNLSPGWRAILAGMAEYLSKEFGLPVPPWTEEPEYFLPEIWDPLEEWVPEPELFREESIAKAHPCFLRRNVLFASRNLIVL